MHILPTPVLQLSHCGDTVTVVTAVSLDAGKANLCDVPGVKEQAVMNKYH